MPNNTIGEAYIQVKPSTDGISGELKKAMGDAGEESSKSFGSSFASGIAKAGAVTAAAVGAAATAAGALVKSAVSEYANFEQLVGGVETLFGSQGMGLEEYSASINQTAEESARAYQIMQEAQNAVMKNAEIAFQTAGLSQNKYMESVTSFAAALKQSTENELEATEVADMAIIDMADNAAKMGSSMESIQNAYQGFAKQNYTMLDNLKLGYGGTKEEMQRLLDDATALTGIEYDMSSLSDVYNAIHAIQENLGIAGTTSKEASETISGSLSMVKASWANLVAGLANPDADISSLMDYLIDSVYTVMDNLMPAIQNGINGLIGALPMMLDFGVTLIDTLSKSILENLPTLIQAGVDVIKTLVSTFIENIPMILDVGLEIIFILADGIIDAIPDLIPAIVDVVLAIVDKLTQPDTLVKLIDAALQIILALTEGIFKALPKLLARLPEIIANIVVGLVKALPAIGKAAAELVMTLITGILNFDAKLITLGKDIVNKVKDGLKENIGNALQWGKDLMDNFIQGIKEKFQALKDAIGNVAQSIADRLGFSEPDLGPLANFHTYAPDMMKLFAEGIKQNLSLVTGAVTDVAEGISGTITMDTSLAGRTPNNVSDSYAGTTQMALAGGGGDITIPVYIGGELLDRIVVNAQTRANYRSGGR